MKIESKVASRLARDAKYCQSEHGRRRMVVPTYVGTTAWSLILIIGCSSSSKQPNPSGTLEAIEVDVSSTLPGRVLTAHPLLGDKISKGDTLVILDTELIALQRAQTETGLGSISAQRTVLRDGLAQAERNLEFLNLQLKRTTDLVTQGLGQQQQLDEITAKRDVAKEQVDAVKHQISALDAEETKLNAALTVFDRQLKEGVVTAPTPGTILLKSVENGEVTTPGKVLYRLADLSQMELRFFVGATDLSRIKISQSLPVMIDALPGKTIAGTVTWISPESEFTPKNAQTRDARLQLVYAVKLSLPNPEGVLHIGMPAEVKLGQ
jgi:HlyD family secretion protein